MEEIIAKSVRTLYIVTYSISIALGAFIMLMGVFMTTIVPEDIVGIAWFVCVMGGVLIGASIAWLVYFCKMPQNAVTFRDGKLYFRNGTVCLPAEVDFIEAKTMLLDGALFNFGKLLVTVRGVRFQIKFVANSHAAANRIYMLKAQYTGAPYPAYGQPVPPQANYQYPAYGQSVPPQTNNQFPVNGQPVPPQAPLYGQPVPPQVNNQPAAVEEPVKTENNREENDG